MVREFTMVRRRGRPTARRWWSWEDESNVVVVDADLSSTYTAKFGKEFGPVLQRQDCRANMVGIAGGLAHGSRFRSAARSRASR